MYEWLSMIMCWLGTILCVCGDRRQESGCAGLLLWPLDVAVML